MAPGRVARTVRTAAAAVAWLCLAPSVVAGQGPGDGQAWRVGVTFGGISTFGVSVERLWDGRSLDVTLGTFAFRDLGLSVIGKQYFGERAARPFVGIGLWALTSWTEPRTGYALVARAPVGLDWSVEARHSVGADIGLNRALAVRRPDPDDDRELNKRIVPLPGIYYRWTP
jgi:hypothetical protein